MSEISNTTPSAADEPKAVAPQEQLAQEHASELKNDAAMKSKRKKALSVVAILVFIALVIYLIWSLVFSHIVSTDNAYVGAESAEITSMVSGQIAEVLVSDTQAVKKGEVLARIDSSDATIALAQAEAELAKARRQYSQSNANSSSLNAQVMVSREDISSAKAQVAQAQVDFARAQDELARRAQLGASGAISKEELATSQRALQTAQAHLDVVKAGLAQAESKRKAAQSNLEASEALIQGTNQSTTPDVLVAQARVDQARLDLKRTEITAPLDGVVARRSVQVGQRIASGASLMRVVPLSQLYVDANFKESQLADVKVGQKVRLTSDLYGKKVEYRGTVIGFSGGTGAAFALIPAQNATGNWIKVVQRLPVRIQLDPKQLAEYPLRVGLSMEATIDTSSK